jgi:hypothetical protein
MTVNAYGTFTGQPGEREFTYGDTPLAIGDTVRVTGYGYGATQGDCGRTGVVTGLGRTRAVIDFPYVGERRIGGACLAKIEVPA